MDTRSEHDKLFDKMVTEAFGRLPEWIREKMNNVAITIEDIVDTQTVEEMGLESHLDLLGLYKGVPQTMRDNSAGFELPDRVVLYRLPILDESDVSGKPVPQVIYETLWHEIAHHVGLSEEEVEEREEEEFGGE